MTSTDDAHLWVTWDDYHQAIEALARQVHDSGWHFDVVLCLARGGLRPGDVFSRVFNVPLAILSTSSYREEGGMVHGELEIARNLTMTRGQMAGRVLLLDDLVDSGVTLEAVHGHVQRCFPSVTEVKTAVLWYKACSTVVPDYYVAHLPSNPWIHQPFEIYDQLAPDQLGASASEASLESDAGEFQHSPADPAEANAGRPS